MTSSLGADNSADRAFRRRIARIRFARTAALVGLVICVTGFLISAFKPRTIILANRVSFGTAGGCFSVGLHGELPAEWAMPVSRPIIPSMGGSVGFVNQNALMDGSSWRPYHAAGFAAHHIVIPIWQPLVVLALVVGLCHGYLRGIRWRDPRTCLGCGHELTPREGPSTCPECGLGQRTSQVPRTA